MGVGRRKLIKDNGKGEDDGRNEMRHIGGEYGYIWKTIWLTEAIES